jgi:uncharacterized protein (DUF2267 family)
MDDREFFGAVAERTGLGRQEAADLTRATLQTLAGRLNDGTLRKLIVALPDGLDEVVSGVHGKPNRRADLEEAEQQISDRTGLRLDEVHAGVRAVLHTIRDTIPRETYAKVAGQLPGRFRDLDGGDEGDGTTDTELN